MTHTTYNIRSTKSTRILCICTRPKKILSSVHTAVPNCACAVFCSCLTISSLTCMNYCAFAQYMCMIVNTFSISCVCVCVYRLGHRQKIRFSLKFSSKNSRYKASLGKHSWLYLHNVVCIIFIIIFKQRASFHAYSQPIKQKNSIQIYLSTSGHQQRIR